MNCVECTWPVEKKGILIKSCSGSGISEVFPCSRCGRLHSTDGKGVFNRLNQAAFFQNGMGLNKDASGKIMSRF